MGDVAPLEVVADARAADAVDALPVALPRAAQYTGFAPMHWGSGRRLLNVERRAPSATTAERKLNTLSFRELCGGSPGNDRLGAAPTSLKTRQQPKKAESARELIDISPLSTITDTTHNYQHHYYASPDAWTRRKHSQRLKNGLCLPKEKTPLLQL